MKNTQRKINVTSAFNQTEFVENVNNLIVGGFIGNGTNILQEQQNNSRQRNLP